jgi:hypothetical protein
MVLKLLLARQLNSYIIRSAGRFLEAPMTQSAWGSCDAGDSCRGTLGWRVRNGHDPTGIEGYMPLRCRVMRSMVSNQRPLKVEVHRLMNLETQAISANWRESLSAFVRPESAKWQLHPPAKGGSLGAEGQLAGRNQRRDPKRSTNVKTAVPEPPQSGEFPPFQRRASLELNRRTRFVRRPIRASWFFS